MKLWNREPSLIIGTAVTIVIGIIATLSGNGFISDATAGRATDLVNAGAQLLVLLAPLVAAVITRSQVYAPSTVDTILAND
jgi:hypothetical protein